MRITPVVSLLILLTISGCSSMSKDECLMADWHTVGFEDGASGRSNATIGEHRRACAKHGVTPNHATYEAGYQQGIQGFCNFSRGHEAASRGYNPNQVCPSESDYHTGFDSGLESFCTYQSGYDYGLAGKSYRGTCPVDLSEDFLSGFDIGSRISSLQNELLSLEQELREVETDRNDNEEDRDLLKEQLILDSDLSVAQRARIILDIDTLLDEDDDLEDAKDSILLRIGELQAELRNFGADI